MMMNNGGYTWLPSESDSPNQRASKSSFLTNNKPAFGLCRSVSVLLVLMASIYAIVERETRVTTLISHNNISYPCGEQRTRECSALMESLVQERSAVNYNCSETNVFVFSHRRSGTHMTVNLLRYGFRNVKVWKMNHISCANCTLINALGNCGVLIHAQRNPLDVAVSMYDYVKVFKPEARRLSLDSFIRNSSLVDIWTSYTQNCNSVSSMIRVDFETTLSSPETTHRILQEKTGLSGHWNGRKVPHTGAIRFNGGKLGQWGASLDDSTLRYVLKQTMSSGYKDGHCSCDRKGHSNDGHACMATMTGFD